VEENIKYYQNIRSELLDLIPQGLMNGRLLEIGAGEGNTLLHAKEEGYASEIHGVELCDLISDQDKLKFNSFIVGNIENINLDFQKEYFDVIICGDVLEHLFDPSAVLMKLRDFLRPDGVMIASIPNIRNWSIVKKIVCDGDFKYEDSGILDRTHVRFYCKRNVEELFQSNGFKLLKITDDKSNKKKSKWLSTRNKFFNFVTFGTYNEFKAIQYFIVAKKAN
jgi:2-polyprenyl-3-methyl-5-hydroxy-6-metoxy-1,4-benzoquinol methylase